uniref:Protein inscuteable homologue C-terminal domain-containing protein n=3 Tax=Dendroctonus ponderosae TaxID=77166 RepID=A0AAR5PQT4_DENPD
MEALEGSFEMNFKRSPSKVWWGSESVEFREVSSSPGSQDSGFSDTESSPNHPERNRKVNGSTTKEDCTEKSAEVNNNEDTPKLTSRSIIAKNIFKGTESCIAGQDNPNLNSNYKEKSTPVKKNIEQRLIKSERRNSPLAPKKFSTESAPFTEPAKRYRYVKHSPKVSRNLFTNKNTKECPDTNANQYSKLTPSASSLSNAEPNEEEETSRLSEGRDYDTSSEISGTKSLPLAGNHREVVRPCFRSAPDLLDGSQSSDLDDSEAVTSFNSTSSESELEQLFQDLEGAGYTSTPKGGSSGAMKQRRRERDRLQERLKLRYQNQERVPPIPTDGVTVDNKAVLRWLEDARLSLEQECTISLQCKSISAELNQKVSHLAACATTILRGLLSHSRCIEMDYRSLNSETAQINPLIQSLTGNIMDFLKTHTLQVSHQVQRLYNQIRSVQSGDALKLLSELFVQWESIQGRVLTDEVKKLVAKLEDPTSDIEMRSTLTGITSVTLRNPDLIQHFVKADIIPILLILCEKCDGSSLRTLILRALSTMCTNSSAIRHFEKFSGIQIIAETLEEESRPEPERSEAVALLAQVTAPWLEDNHSIKGLQEYSQNLVQSLTKFSVATRCCQNLLLCAAALANLSSMDNKCIKHLIQSETAPTLLSAVRNRGPLVSVILLEQVATLIANMAAMEGARENLTSFEAPVALLHFLKSARIPQNEDVERRLQQKSVIALSRLCGDVEAAKQVVENGGLTRLVQLCRERDARYNSDAVLVATLATFRKIAEACGRDVFNDQDCQELVEPKLLDSFLAYSAQNESYV